MDAQHELELDPFVSGLLSLVVFLGIPLAMWLGHRWERRHPRLRPYAWGYFQGLCYLIGLLLAGWCLWMYPAGSEFAIELQRVAVFGFMGVLGIFILCRHRWAWVLAIVQGPFPLNWTAEGFSVEYPWDGKPASLIALLMVVINTIYLKNRWQEMAGRPPPEPSDGNNNSSSETPVLDS